MAISLSAGVVARAILVDQPSNAGGPSDARMRSALLETIRGRISPSRCVSRMVVAQTGLLVQLDLPPLIRFDPRLAVIDLVWDLRMMVSAADGQ